MIFLLSGEFSLFRYQKLCVQEYNRSGDAVFLTETHEPLLFQLTEYYKKAPQYLQQQIGQQLSQNISRLLECEGKTYALSSGALYVLHIFSHNNTVIYQKAVRTIPGTNILCVGNTLYLKDRRYLTNYRSKQQIQLPE